MTEQPYDVMVIGSGAGGAAVAHKMVNAGKRVLMLEKGDRLPRDGSTLDVKNVFAEGRFKNQRLWVDGHNQQFVPGEFYNVGGKTKWYGAALLRFAPHEFAADEAFACRGWPIVYDELAPYYAEAEELLHVTPFENEPELAALVDKLCRDGSGWKVESLPLGLKKEILQHEQEAKHFDGFASACGFKSDAEISLLRPLEAHDNFQLLANSEVNELLPHPNQAFTIKGVQTLDGSVYEADQVVLAAGAMTSPRILQDYLQAQGSEQGLTSIDNVGANFKMHLNSALLAFSPFTKSDVLRKTAIFFNDTFPHSTVQCLGWMDGEIMATQLPAAVPKFVTNAAGRRAYGFFVTTEDGSHPDNRIISCGQTRIPVMDYDLERIRASVDEHHALLSAFGNSLLRAGMLGVHRFMGLAGTAHALGSLVCGNDPTDSVVDAAGKVHGMDNLYVADGSVLPRSSRVNPALTIYAWGLRLGERLGKD